MTIQPQASPDKQFEALAAQMPISYPHPDPKSGIDVMQAVDRALGPMGDGTHLPADARGSQEAARQADQVPDEAWARFVSNGRVHDAVKARKSRLHVS